MVAQKAVLAAFLGGAAQGFRLAPPKASFAEISIHASSKMKKSGGLLLRVHATSKLMQGKVDPSEWDCNIQGQEASSFMPLCEKLCPETSGDGTGPNRETCSEYICPTLSPCVTSGGKIGSFQQLMMCIQRLEEAHPNDEVDEEFEDEVSREIAGEEYHNHEDDGEDRAMWEEHVEGKDGETFHQVCLAKCPDHDGEGHPGLHDCEHFVCPHLQVLIIITIFFTSSYILLVIT